MVKSVKQMQFKNYKYNKMLIKERIYNKRKNI